MINLYVTLHLAGVRFVDTMKARHDERGQTAAEYLGIIVVVAAIIGVLAKTDIGTDILNGIKDQIKKITGGGKA